ncbi:hypothetical protein E5F42_20280 [Clostridioides difficile]|uniref:hypothetical protein n=1 Tax=Clostridioides difficile TaxID=1496 RepID=UPI0009441E6B|nr:hypothetical protein [Clostridioides difficile]EGT4739797.1 hypothetical protein [Clostridioides difficile]MDL0364536.1 hypothetical protein [Clostridioides difficile]MDL0378926.1 hypothetical protein [Clostridioides difficile]MDN9637726.1 hypothetical protein [Clostridioides difficile]TFZ89211.1 hypothetical protein E5F42_20280 [Clostridioides difficile]
MKKTKIEEFITKVKESMQSVTKESIKDLENILKEIETGETEVKILFIDKEKKVEEIVEFTHDEYVKMIIEKMIFDGLKIIKEQHEKILKEFEEREV